MNELYGGKLMMAIWGVIFFLTPIVCYVMVFHSWQFIGFMIGYVCAFVSCVVMML